jgi:molybdopterin biosynthesis enzyme
MEGETQRIARLTPLPEVLSRIDAMVGAVAPRRIATASAVGHVLAEDVIGVTAVPAGARALRDGFAVAADATSDASAYAPIPLTPPRRVEVGGALPDDADAIAPLDIIVERDGQFAAIAPVVPGDGVLSAGADIGAGTMLRRAGSLVRAADAAALAAAGIADVAVRAPRICVAAARPGHDAVVAAAVELIASAIAAAGGVVRRSTGELATALADKDADAIIVIGGSGRGRNDASVRALAAAGHVEVHGVALTPGETAAFGMTDQRPVLIAPGRLDAALAVWLTLGRKMLARLAGRMEEPAGSTAVLTRKHASPLGFSEVVPVCASGGKVEPIASGYWPLRAMVEANGWILVPAESEGYPAGADVVLRPWP